MDFDKEILKGYINLMILSVLSNEDMYGYLIAKTIKEVSEDDFEIKEATLYVSLKRLEKNKYVQGYWDDSQGTSGGRRRYYCLTEEGKLYFKKCIEEWKELSKIMNKFLGGKISGKN